MLHAEIKVRIYVDEEKLTPEQQIQASKADRDMRQDYPLDYGVDNLRDVIESIGLLQFGYLKEGSKAVEIIVE